jgi:Mrp family chromosome partitioning ATPase
VEPPADRERTTVKQSAELEEAPASEATDPGEALELRTAEGDLVQVAPPAVTESLRYLVVRMRLSRGADLPERLGITSTVSGEGVSYVVRSLALVLAHDVGRRVCLLDVNWWQPTQWGAVPDRPGLADVIREDVGLDEVLVSTDHPGLSILPAGPTTHAQRPLLANRPELAKTLVDLSERFDHVLIDLPAIQATSEALTLAECCGNVALVVCDGVATDSHVKAALEELVGVNLLGVVFNRNATKIPAFIRRRIPGA